MLVVDATPISADGLALALRTMGHEVRVAIDGPSALETAAQFRPEVMLLDIGLPGMDGYEVARRVRAKGALPALVLVAVTGYGREEDRLKAREAGFDHYLVKPITPDAILACPRPTN